MRKVTVDGNEAAARVAFLTNEVISIYPITPASPMGELADAWAAQRQTNIFGAVPQVAEMQSEGGAAGAVHGALQAGALTTTFTASQGLLLMMPNMFKIAGELTSTVFHIAARTVATHALSIFGDHSDVMAVRSTGWGMLAASSVQEAQDMAMIAQMATLKARVPFLNFFDGFRTSHEVNKIALLEKEDVQALIDDDLVIAHRDRALNPDRPVLRGTAQNPDVFFQAREACNPFYQATPAIVSAAMNRLADRTGRQYRLFDYFGAADAERVIILMGSGVGAAKEAIAKLNDQGQRVGMVAIRLFRPFCTKSLIKALPASTRIIAALDRTKEPGATGEPLYQDVLTAVCEAWSETHKAAQPRVVGGRYGLSSKEFTPAMIAGLFDELKKDAPKNHFTIGINDDVSQTSLPWDDAFSTEREADTRALFYGLGSDGTVGATKNTVKIIGENTDLHAQGYFVYDSRKSGAVTVSHLRISREPIESSYLIDRANFVGCHQFNFLEKMDVLSFAEEGATFLLNSPYDAATVWDELPRDVQQVVISKRLRFYVVDALTVAREAKLGGRINTVMQTCFFALSKMLPQAEAIDQIKQAIKKTYAKAGETVLRRNYDAVDGALAALCEVSVPKEATSQHARSSALSDNSPDFVQRVTAMILAGHGDKLPVSALPVDGTFPTATAKWEKRSIAQEIPIWDAGICTSCGLCSVACPHAAIRMKAYPERILSSAPEGFRTRVYRGKEIEGQMSMTIQVAPDDCTGCGVCVDLCPARSKEVVKHKAINMQAKSEHLERERSNFDFFLSIPSAPRDKVKRDTVKGSQLFEPLFEYSGACAGCGETPYLKLLTQLFGDRMVVANATGCSSIYGGNLPTTPWTQNAEGRGPTWSNSLFEDNAEFGFGMRLAVDQQQALAQHIMQETLADDPLVAEIISAPQETEADIIAQRQRVEKLKSQLKGDQHAHLMAVADALVDRSVWIVGGDGWAYDIGFSGLDHVLASGRNINVIVLDTEVYSNTGGQASKATPRGAVAKFAASGKSTPKKDLGMIAMAYGNVYVAQIALGASPRQTIRAMLEAAAYPGPSLLIAYSTCIAHGIDMSTSQSHMQLAVKSGYWPIYRYVPQTAGMGQPFQLDCRKPTVSFKEFALQEARFSMLARSNPKEAERLFALAQQDINERWQFYSQLANVERAVVHD
ncbi:MAG: pyruvate:ferredoxin (flavodoxin) oxidoreductase [Deltaproteobacteria bacterium]|nr:pyruvate:ferredoxin (flavodoxin) oxidoreductase [Deltaproteobacteria bacterium]